MILRDAGPTGWSKRRCSVGLRRSKSTSSVRWPARARLAPSWQLREVLPSPAAALLIITVRTPSVWAAWRSIARVASIDSVKSVCQERSRPPLGGTSVRRWRAGRHRGHRAQEVHADALRNLVRAGDAAGAVFDVRNAHEDQGEVRRDRPGRRRGGPCLDCSCAAPRPAPAD